MFIACLTCVINDMQNFQLSCRRGETYVTLFKFVMGQSKAAAQGTGIALGSYHSIGLLSKSDGESPEYAMYAFGRGFHGQLGQGAHESQSLPHRIDEVDRDSLPVQLYTSKPGDINLAVVNAGSSHTTAISRRGELFTWGLASSGELGHGGWTPIEVSVPRMVSNLGRTRIVSVCAGDNHTLAISESGQLWSCGRGRHGQLGHGHFHDEGMMTLISSIHRERIVSVSAGKAHSIALAADGKLFTWGDASHGQLGHNQLAPLVGDNRQPIAIPFPQAITSLDPTKLQPPERVTAIAAGGNHSMAVTVGGSLLAFGSNSSGQLGLGDTENRFTPTKVSMVGKGGAAVRAVQVQCGAAHSILLAQRLGRMEVKTVGDNSYGQLGHGDLVTRREFATINALTNKKIMCVSSGDFHVAAIDESGKLYTWGRGDCGQLGHGDDKSRWTPKLLEDFSVVHPDRTLRRNRKKVPKPLILSGSELEQMPEVGRRPNNPYRPSWRVAMF
jgi:alpha-tubulin suppressor-like RCC1 family protein